MTKKAKEKKDIGLAAQPPRERCENDKCPWHGRLPVRGRIFRGKVVSSRAAHTAIVEWDYYQRVRKYQRSQRKRTRISVHNPSCISAKAGDIVRIGECRPLSKTKSFVIIEKI